MGGCSAALHNSEEGAVANKVLEMSRGQAEHLMPMIDELLIETRVGYNNIDKIAVTKGPGAFTGMRIGLAAAKSLSISLDIPIVGVCTFDSVLQTHMNDNRSSNYEYYGVLLETKRRDYYFRMFDGDSLEPCSEKLCASSEDVIELIGDRRCAILGDASQRFMSEIETDKDTIYYDIKLPCPYAVAQCSIHGGGGGCEPVYLRAPEIGVPKNPPRKMKS